MTTDQTLDRVRAYRTVGVWPSRNDLNVEGWISNFATKDIPLAIALLRHFTYYSEQMAREVLRKAVRQTTAEIWPSVAERQSRLPEAIFTCPPGEDDRPTASGYTYLRMLREIGVAGSQTFQPDEAILAKAEQPDRPLVVVDDFSCTGAQFDHYWRTQRRDTRGAELRPEELAPPIFFCPLFATWMAQRRMAAFKNVQFRPVHEVTGILNLPDVKAHRNRLRALSLSLGAVDSNGKSTEDWKGFGALSHAVAVGGTIPDSCLPIFYMESDTWTALKKRRE